MLEVGGVICQTKDLRFGQEIREGGGRGARYAIDHS